MKKIIYAVIIIIVGVFIITTFKETPKPQEVSKSVNDNSEPAIKAVYFHGGYNQELYELQKRNNEESKGYYHLIRSQDELLDVITKYDLQEELGDGRFNPTKDFFEDNIIIAIYPGQGSSSIYYAVKSVYENGAWNIDIEKTIPEVQTSDMINRVIFIEMDKKLFEKWQKVAVKIIEKKVSNDVYIKEDLTIDDLMLGSAKIGMKKEELIKAMGEPERAQSHPEGKEERIYYGGLQIMLMDNTAYFIETLDPKHSTPRGLKVGDSKERLIELYGEPSDIVKDTSTGASIYSFDLSGEYYLFHAELMNDEIIRLQVNSAD